MTRFQDIGRGEYRIVCISPEMLQSNEVRKVMSTTALLLARLVLC